MENILTITTFPNQIHQFCFRIRSITNSTPHLLRQRSYAAQSLDKLFIIFSHTYSIIIAFNSLHFCFQVQLHIIYRP